MPRMKTEEKTVKVPENPVDAPVVEEEIQEGEEELLKLPFPNATVVREMKKYIASDKMIRKEVKIAMNKFLGEVVKELAARMNKFPYSTVDFRMFQDAARPYQQIKEIDKERQRLEAHLDAIIQDCYSVKRDLDSKFGEKHPEEVQL